MGASYCMSGADGGAYSEAPSDDGRHSQQAMVVRASQPPGRQAPPTRPPPPRNGSSSAYHEGADADDRTQRLALPMPDDPDLGRRLGRMLDPDVTKHVVFAPAIRAGQSAAQAISMGASAETATAVYQCMFVAIMEKTDTGDLEGDTDPNAHATLLQMGKEIVAHYALLGVPGDMRVGALSSLPAPSAAASGRAAAHDDGTHTPAMPLDTLLAVSSPPAPSSRAAAAPSNGHYNTPPPAQANGHYASPGGRAHPAPRVLPGLTANAPAAHASRSIAMFDDE